MSNIDNLQPSRPLVKSLPARLLGTTYQNLTGKPMFVAVGLQSVAAGQNSAYFNVDAATPPTTPVAAVLILGAAGTQGGSVGFWVMPGEYYLCSVGLGAFTINAWTEWH